MSKTRCTRAQIVAALKKTKGTMYLAAKRLGIDVRTMTRYLDRYPDIRDMVADLRGELVDTSELKLWNAVEKGERWAIVLVLQTQGKDRGYVTGSQTEHKGKVEVEHSVSAEQRREFFRVLGEALAPFPEAKEAVARILEGGAKNADP